MDEYQKTAFSIASEVPKQLITLSTAIVALGATFTKDLFTSAANGMRTYFYWSTASFLVSVLFGIFTLGALAGGLERSREGEDRGSIYKANILAAQIIQIVLFFVAVGLFVYYCFSAGAIPVDNQKTGENTRPPLKNIDAQPTFTSGESIVIPMGKKSRIVIESVQ